MTQTSNQSSIHFVEQTQLGAIPANPVFKELDTTSGRLNKTVSYNKSETIRADGQATRNIRDSVSYESEFAFEVTRDIIDLIPSAFRINGAKPTLTTVTANTLSFDATSKEIRDSANGLGGFTANAFVFVSGATNPEYNRGYFVNSVSAGALVLEVEDGFFADLPAGDNITISQRTFRSGVTPNYLAFQEREEDESAPSNDTSYITQRDAIINTMTITIPSEGAITCSIGIVSGTQLEGNAPIAGQTDEVKVERQPLSNLDLTWYPDQREQRDTFKFTDTTIEISSNSEAVRAAGVEGAVTNTINTITVTGSLNSIGFLSDPRVEKRKQEDGTVFGMSYLVEFENGEKAAITLQRMRYTEGSRERANDTVATFSGTYDAETGVSGSTIQIDFNY